jgi:hypothetical protein
MNLLLLGFLMSAATGPPDRVRASGGDVIVIVEGCADAAPEIAARIEQAVTRPHTVRIVPHSAPADSDLVSGVLQDGGPVHTIDVKCEGGLFRRIGHGVVGFALWLVEVLIGEDPLSYSSDNTAETLMRISKKTGGEICVASSRAAALRCADTIAERISGAAVDRCR